MKIRFLAFDSFSTRSMSTFIETQGRKIIIDPSIAIAPKRYGLPPHPIELKELEFRRKIIEKYLEIADTVIITHYHWDHCPKPNSKLIEKIIEKNIFLKDPKKNINLSQKNRAINVISKINKLNNNIIIAEGYEDGLLKFSKAVPHGLEGSKLGYVVMVGIKDFLFGSDVQGPASNKAKEFIIDYDPKILVLSGPMTRDKKMLDEAIKNLLDIINKTNVKTIILDHHLLRDLNWKEKIKEIIAEINNKGINLITAAEYEGYAIKQLEAHRFIFWKEKQL